MNHDLAEMDTLDIFLSNISKDEYESIKHKIGHRKDKPMPLLSWGFFMEAYHRRIDEARKKTDLDTVLAFARKFGWKNELQDTFDEQDYEALIITDKDQKIIWVSDGFTSMTGYTRSFAVQRTPRFLQGELTSEETKQRIKTNLALDKPFKEVIINHRKDNSPYKCEVQIVPLYSNKTTHFIAFERQVV
ncbi:MAG: PAS domain-containing protein [Bacteroidota bacterium]